MTSRSLSRNYLVALSFVATTALYACGGGSGGGNKGGGGGDNGGGGGGSAGEQTSDGGSAAGNSGQGGSSDEGGTPGNTGGTPANTGGTPANTGGTKPNTGGTPANTGGTPPAPSGDVCPASGNCKMLAIGDTLAAGTGAGSGYLNYVANYLRTAPAARRKMGFEWVGSKGSGANKHEGTDKQLSSALAGTISGIITATMPNIVVLNTGSEDVQTNAQAGLHTRIKDIIMKIRAARPGTYILVTGTSRTADTSQFASNKPVPRYTSSAYTVRAYKAEVEVEKMVDDLKDTRVRFLRFNFSPQYAAAEPNRSGPVSGNFFQSNTYAPNNSGYDNMSKLGIGPALQQVLHH